MTNVFYRLHVFIKRHKFLSIAALISLLGTSLFFASKIRLEENIINLVPQDENIHQINKVLDGFKMNSRLVVHVYFNDTASSDPQALIDISHRFVDSISSAYPDLVGDVKLAFPDTQLQQLYDFYGQHLPLYLSLEDYEEIEMRTSEDGINRTIENSYKTLISPVSVFARKMLVKDPFGFLGIPLENTRKLQVDDNFELYQNHLLTKDRRHLIFFLGLAYSANETANNGILIDGMNALISEFQDHEPSINIEYFGQMAVAVANAGQIKQDIILTVSLALLALFLFITLFYRRIRMFFIAVTPGLFGATVALACLALIKTSVSVISLGVGAVLLGITIDYALHFATHYKDQRNVSVLFKDLTMPLLMSSATTACAFFSLLFIRSNALADLGIFAGISVLVASVYTLTVFPFFVVGKYSVDDLSNKENFIERLITRAAQYPYHKAKWSLGAFVILSAVSLFTWKNYGFEENMLRLSYMPENLARYEKNLNEISTYSANNVYLISTGATLWEALEQELVAKQALQDLQEAGEIFSYTLVNDFLPAPSVQQARVDQWNQYWKDKNVDSLLQKFGQKAVEKGFRPDGFHAFAMMLKQNYGHLNEVDAKTMLDVVGEEFIIEEEGQVSLISTIKTDQVHKSEVLRKLSRLEGPLVFDMGYLTTHLVKLLQEDFNQLVNLSLVAVFLLIFIHYGRIELALIVFAPILLSWLWILGLMGLCGIQFNIVNIIVCTFVFGLGIDFSIFSMQGHKQGYVRGRRNLGSYRKSILLSAITTLLSLGVLIFADHPALKSIASLAIIGISSVIFITFTVQPILYNLLISDRKKKGGVPYTIITILLSVFAFSYFLLGCILLTVLRYVLALPLGSKSRRKNIYHWVMMWFCRSLVFTMANVKKSIVDKENADFDKPAVIIANHHSFLDIVLLLMFHPKVIMVTNDWVYNSPFFGKIVQYADFVLSAKGLEGQLESIKAKLDDGFSIIIFPEGKRSESFELSRFHKGAFYLAHHFQLDIQPILLHGTNYTMPQRDPFYLKSGKVTIKFLPRIRYESFKAETYSVTTKSVSQQFKKEYQQLREMLETPTFFKEIILKNYIYKGPVLEWYLRIKYRLDGAYESFHHWVPRQATIVDVGCGFGLLSYSLALSSNGRNILGIDYDEDKIEIAKECPVIPSNLKFECHDVVNYVFAPADIFIISDMLHYLLKEEQKVLLDKVVANLNQGGKIIIRDGDSDKRKKHKGTKLTETYSTRSGFNKTKNPLNFISGKMIEDFAAENQLKLTILDNAKFTSNVIFILEKRG